MLLVDNFNDIKQTLLIDLAFQRFSVFFRIAIGIFHVEGRSLRTLSANRRRGSNLCINMSWIRRPL